MKAPETEDEKNNSSLIFHMFPHSGLKDFLLQMWETQIRATNVCVHMHFFFFFASVCMCVCVWERLGECYNEDYFPVMRKGCTRLPHTGLVAHKHWSHRRTCLAQEITGVTRLGHGARFGEKKNNKTTRNATKVRLSVRANAGQSCEVWWKRGDEGGWRRRECSRRMELVRIFSLH